MIVLAVVIALVAAGVIGVGAAGARAAVSDVLAVLDALQTEQRHALALARVEATRAQGLRRVDGEG